MEESSSSPQDQRRYPRRPFGARFGILQDGKYLVFNAVELGERGAGVESDLILKKNDILVVSFFVQGHFVVCRAEIRYILPKELGSFFYGVEFVNIKFEDRRNVRDFIAKKGEAETLFYRKISAGLT